MEMQAGQGGFPRWFPCWSTHNFCSFLAWFHEVATLQEQLETKDLYTIDHRAVRPQFMKNTEVDTESYPQVLKIQGKRHIMKSKKCVDPDCRRCKEGR